MLHFYVFCLARGSFVSSLLLASVSGHAQPNQWLFCLTKAAFSHEVFPKQHLCFGPSQFSRFWCTMASQLSPILAGSLVACPSCPCSVMRGPSPAPRGDWFIMWSPQGRAPHWTSASPGMPDGSRGRGSACAGISHAPPPDKCQLHRCTDGRGRCGPGSESQRPQFLDFLISSGSGVAGGSVLAL